MNKEELKKQINKEYESRLYDYDDLGAFKEMVFDYIDQLDEPSKPVVPDYVGEWIDSYKKKHPDHTLLEVGSDLYDELLPTVIDDWLMNSAENRIKFSEAFQNGYTVEEKKYYVLDKNGYILLRRYEDEGVSFMKISTTLTVKKFEKRAPDRLDSIQLTEQEIKDYDERYWSFAKEVQS